MQLVLLFWICRKLQWITIADDKDDDGDGFLLLAGSSPANGRECMHPSRR